MQKISSTGAVVISRAPGVVADGNVIRELIVDVNLSFLSQGILCNGLKGLLNINSFLGTCFKVGHVVLALGPLLSSFHWDLKPRIGDKRQRHHSSFININPYAYDATGNKRDTYGSILNVNFVPYKYKGEVLGVSWRGLDEKLVTPAVEGFEGLRSRDVKD